MNIYKARKLQALLFKRSGADFKRMRAFVCDGKCPARCEEMVDK